MHPKRLQQKGQQCTLIHMNFLPLSFSLGPADDTSPHAGHRRSEQGLGCCQESALGRRDIHIRCDDLISSM
jgi:hypothetical protein